jgi:SAM-dependent methyltransferase
MLRFGKRSMYPPRTADLAGTRPVSRSFGYDRGTPVDRLYIEEFLAAHSAYVTGRVLEVGESTYSARFGKGVTRQDVLHVRDDPRATLVADLGAPDSLPENAFDCIILTQTLHLIYDMPAAVRELRRALRPGGVALVTVPGVSSVDVGEWGSCWCWSLTGHSALKLFGSEFGEQNVDVVVYGNVYAATSFLHGLAVEELDRGDLNVRDPAYPVLVGVCARRAAA